MRLVSWNIRAGGGSRVPAILDQIARWSPDLVAICEFRATPASHTLAASLREMGFVSQLSTADPVLPARNGLLLASRLLLRRLLLRRAPTEPGRWLLASVQARRPFSLGVMHLPNMVTGRKLGFMDAVAEVVGSWRRGPGLLIGDTNCGWPGLDEETPVFGPRTAAWLDGLHARGWQDAFRYFYPQERVYTWYSPNAGNGFRLDQAFVNRSMLPRLRAARYEWGQPAMDCETRRDALSDHAALILEIED
ncbi:MAG TPA: endonuclease/exonuclease/phosphatase family protein [Dehalococcoidia bacterium]|nr:endonuclease/exonuclease/phosphatase family protein [Dehalococcoidia bacterium]